MAEVTTAFRVPIRSRLEHSGRTREDTHSFETSTPCPASRAARCVDLPPGAAQRSSTVMPGEGSSASITEEADGSCI